MVELVENLFLLCLFLSLCHSPFKIKINKSFFFLKHKVNLLAINVY